MTDDRYADRMGRPARPKHGGVNFETELVWERDPEEMEYVREKWTAAGTRTRPVPWSGAGNRVGYAVLEDDAPNSGSPGVFYRRVFFLKEHDRPEGGDMYNKGTPSEGVDPLTAEPGVRGEKTNRSEGFDVE